VGSGLAAKTSKFFGEISKKAALSGLLRRGPRHSPVNFSGVRQKGFPCHSAFQVTGLFPTTPPTFALSRSLVASRQGAQKHQPNAIKGWISTGNPLAKLPAISFFD
jgi:hypothetical protein